MANFLFDRYKNSFMPHGKYMFQTASGMTMETMCCKKCPRIDLKIPESDQKN